MSSPSSQRSWLKPFLQPLKPVFREVLAMSAFVNLLALGIPVFTMQVYDRVVAHSGISTLWGLLIGMVFVVVFDLLLKHSRSRIMQTVALRVDVLVGRQLFNKFVSLPLHVLESKPANHWQSLFRDVDVIRNTLSGASALLMADLPFALLFFGLILVIAPPLAGVLLVIIPVFMFVAWKSASSMAAANTAERATTQNRDSLIAEMIAGRATIKALALDQSMRPMWEMKHAENIEQSVTRGSKTDFFTNLGASLTMVTSLLLTSVGAYYIVIHELTMGALVATNMLSGRLLGPLNQLVGQWRTYNSFKQSVERLGEVFQLESERQTSEVTLERPKGEIRMEGVSFAYGEDMAPVVDNVTISIRAGGVHAMVGRNGSGKTTVMKLIQGLYKPTTGRVLLDGADISQFTRIELAHWMGYVPQESVLFAGTVRDNIIHRFPKATDDEIIRAATQAGVHHFIIDLPDGYGTEIGEAGQRLSGGQRQRIAIARALVGDPPVLLMDEPSASLDRQAEQELRQTLSDIGRQRTVILITHSPILLAACDDLVALDRGKVALAGPSREILPKLFGQSPKAAQAAAVARPGGPGMRPAARPAAQAAPAVATPRPPVPAPAQAQAKAAPAAPPAAKPRPPAPALQAPRAAGQAVTPTPPPGSKPVTAPALATRPAPRPAAAAPAGKPARPAPTPAVPGGPGNNNQPTPATADPSVPGGNMFRLPEGGRATGDPYADLLSAVAGKGPTVRPRN
jgi:ATP-binding cassette subfamily C protein LapB